MSKPSSSKASRTDWKRVDALRDKEVDLSDNSAAAQALAPGCGRSAVPSRTALESATAGCQIEVSLSGLPTRRDVMVAAPAAPAHAPASGISTVPPAARRPGSSLLDIAGLQIDIEEALGVKVDLRTEAELHPRLKERILAEARPL
jgi:hypothetical protein